MTALLLSVFEALYIAFELRPPSSVCVYIFIVRRW